MPTKPSPLYEPCKTCHGSRLAPPDHAIHESLPEGSPKVARRHRAGRVPCPGCQGVGFLPTTLTWDQLRDQAAELDAALKVLADFVELCHDSVSGEGVNYLADGALVNLCVRSVEILRRDDEVPKTPARRAV